MGTPTHWGVTTTAVAQYIKLRHPGMTEEEARSCMLAGIPTEAAYLREKSSQGDDLWAFDGILLIVRWDRHDPLPGSPRRRVVVTCHRPPTSFPNPSSTPTRLMGPAPTGEAPLGEGVPVVEHQLSQAWAELAEAKRLLHDAQNDIRNLRQSQAAEVLAELRAVRRQLRQEVRQLRSILHQVRAYLVGRARDDQRAVSLLLEMDAIPSTPNQSGSLEET